MGFCYCSDHRLRQVYWPALKFACRGPARDHVQGTPQGLKGQESCLPGGRAPARLPGPPVVAFLVLDLPLQLHRTSSSLDFGHCSWGSGDPRWLYGVGLSQSSSFSPFGELSGWQSLSPPETERQHLGALSSGLLPGDRGWLLSVAPRDLRILWYWWTCPHGHLPAT